MASIIYQVQISLKDFNPKVWRRLLINADMFLSDFHKVIQSSMGWSNSHMHQFIKNGQFFNVKMEDDDYWDEMDNVDYGGLTVSDLIKSEKEVIIYEYDFGDSWEHNVLLEKIIVEEKSLKYPVCIKGKNNCPPEDCGGVWGYADLLKTLKNPKNPEYKDITEWIGEDFDPKYFNIDEINELLKQDDFGTYSFF